MRVPLSWLREFVRADMPFAELVEVMGRNGLEVEEVRTPGAGVKGVRVARVLEVSDHPDADRLVVVRIHDGDAERVVCAGARNIAPGDHVPYAPPGATLPAPDGGVFEIGQREMRGVVSDGMLCSPRELEVADDHSGILVLDEPAEPGTDIRDLFPIGEPVLDVAVPADRGDLQSVFGVARDLAAILDVEVEPLPDPEARGEYGEVPVRVDADRGCSRYVGWVVEGLRVGPSPWWLRRRLEVCGVRSLSNLVDVTNYVMLERGQPLHAFDLDHVRGPEIVVRWAEPGEPLRTLDGRDRTLAADDLVIADAARAIALAGVMGGEETEVGDGTTRVLLESAAFDPTAVRRTSRRLGLVSEASIRFERRVDPDGCMSAAARAVAMLAEIAGGSDRGVRVSGAGDEPPVPIVIDAQATAAFLGLPGLGRDEQVRLLERAGVRVSPQGSDLLEAVPPSWRSDLARPADLAEEIARLHGYERIPALLPPIAIRGGLTQRQRAEREVRAAVRASGAHEAQTSPFVSTSGLALLAPHEEDRVRLENPVAKDTDVMRGGLAESLLQAARRNVGQGRDGLALFEIARIFRPAGGSLDAVLTAHGGVLWAGPDDEALPTQPFVLGLVAYGFRQGRGWVDRDDTWDVFGLLGIFDDVSSVLDSGMLEREAAARDGLHPTRTVALLLDGDEIGIVGQLDPREADRRDLPESTVVGEVLLDVLWGTPALRRAEPIPRHPAVSVDIAVVVDEEVRHAAIRDAVRDGAGEVLHDLRLFDEYRGDQIGSGKKSLAFHLRLQLPDRQLTDADAEATIARVSDSVARIGGALRS